MGDNPDVWSHKWRRSPGHEADADVRTTSLTIDNIAVYQVGEVIEALREAGFEVEINVARQVTDG